jgi:hypothetical protein
MAPNMEANRAMACLGDAVFYMGRAATCFKLADFNRAWQLLTSARMHLLLAMDIADFYRDKPRNKASNGPARDSEKR